MLPNILGKDASHILYWAGKDLARKVSSSKTSMKFLISLSKPGGAIYRLNGKGKQMLEFELTSPIVKERIKKREQSTFQIEAGFLAQQVEQQKKVVAEAYEHPKKRAGKVIFTVKWDNRDNIE